MIAIGSESKWRRSVILAQCDDKQQRPARKTQAAGPRRDAYDELTCIHIISAFAVLCCMPRTPAAMNTVQYSSTSSDSDGETSGRTLNFARLQLDVDTVEHNLLQLCEDEKKSHERAETILLQHNQMTQFPINLCKFTNLITLDISSNNLTQLPDVFKSSSLNTFIAKNNCFTNEGLPKSFSTCNLRELNLSGNHLTHFPEQIFDFANLKYLYLGGNHIGSISRNIWKLSNLQILSMGGNRLTEVPTALGTLTQLQALVLCDNLLESLPANIAHLHNLKSLMLHKNQLRTLPPEIVTLKHLTELSLRDNPLVVRFVTDLTHNPTSLLELSARVVKVYQIPVQETDVPKTLYNYLQSAHHCVNPKCRGVFFDNRVEHIKFVDFCGKYRIPLLQYLCSSKCVTDSPVDIEAGPSHLMRKVLLG